MPEPENALPLATRIWFAWLCFFRVLFDGAFASRAWDAREPKALPPPPPPEPSKPVAKPVVTPEPAPTNTAALQLLALFQREGRLVDFLEQEIAGFSDQEIGSVVRVVHEGCRKALREHAKLSPVRDEEEGAPVTLEAGFNPAEVKLSGNVQGSAPYKGVLRYHLGIIVPKDAEACRIRVGDDFRHWQEGKSLIFDDTFNHEVWNDTDETRVVLFVDVLRPLPEPYATINRWIVKAIGWSPFVLDAKRNQEAWEARYRERRPAGAIEAAVESGV